jgi:cytochrome d ubiquinol oxidase subunit II
VVVAAILVLALNLYVLFGGADFGGGVWDLFASGPRRAAQRELIAATIGPIWEANHVWLVLVVVLLFVCFPPAFARIAIALHIPISLMLVGVVLRGSAFTFRTYDSEHDAVQRRWGFIFAVASVITPVLLGITVGALTSGMVGAATTGSFHTQWIAPWLNPFAFSVGAFTLVLFAFLAAVYLAVEAAEGELREDFRKRAIASAIAVGVLAWGVIAIARTSAPKIADGLMSAPFSLPLHIVTAVVAVTTIWALVARRFRLARVTAAMQVSLILWGWAYAQFPDLVPGVWTIQSASAPEVTLRLVIYGLAGGAVILVPSLLYLFRVFKGSRGAFESIDAAR